MRYQSQSQLILVYNSLSIHQFLPAFGMGSIQTLVDIHNTPVKLLTSDGGLEVEHLLFVPRIDEPWIERRRLASSDVERLKDDEGVPDRIISRSAKRINNFVQPIYSSMSEYFYFSWVVYKYLMLVVPMNFHFYRNAFYLTHKPRLGIFICRTQVVKQHFSTPPPHTKVIFHPESECTWNIFLK